MTENPQNTEFDQSETSSGSSSINTNKGIYDDSELIQLFRSGDNSNYAFNMLVKKHQQRIYFHVRRLVIDHDDANDIVQNTFIKAWKGLENFREDSQFFTWLYRIATNESLTFLKKKRTRVFIPIINVEQQLAHKIDTDPLFTADKLQQKLHKAILTLPEKQRLVFNMRYFDEIKYEEMSEILGTSVGALKASYHHAVSKVQKYIKGD